MGANSSQPTSAGVRLLSGPRKTLYGRSADLRVVAMKRIKPFRNAHCGKCAPYARTHRKLDWLARFEASTRTSCSGVLPLGATAVQDSNSGDTKLGTDAFVCSTGTYPHIGCCCRLRSILPLPAPNEMVFFTSSLFSFISDELSFNLRRELEASRTFPNSRNDKPFL